MRGAGQALAVGIWLSSEINGSFVPSTERCTWSKGGGGSGGGPVRVRGMAVLGPQGGGVQIGAAALSKCHQQKSANTFQPARLQMTPVTQVRSLAFAQFTVKLT